MQAAAARSDRQEGLARRLMGGEGSGEDDGGDDSKDFCAHGVLPAQAVSGGGAGAAGRSGDAGGLRRVDRCCGWQVGADELVVRRSVREEALGIKYTSEKVCTRPVDGGTQTL